MPQPKLHHPLNVVIEPLDTDSTIYDEHAREQIQVVSRSPSITIAAQVEYRDFVQHAQADASYDRRGIKAEERGYLLIRYIDAKYVENGPYVPRIGDKITMIGLGSETPQPMTAFVHRMKPTAHYPRLGKTMVKLFYADRKPAING